MTSITARVARDSFFFEEMAREHENVEKYT